MKRTQKALAAVTALALAASLAVPVLADDDKTTTIDNNTDNKKAEIPVTATYDLQTVYHVDIAWNDMSFTYEPGTWTPEGDKPLTYTKTGERVGWNDYNGANAPTGASHNITITNKSNSNVSVKIKFEPIEAESGRVQAAFYDGSKEIDPAKGIWMERADANVNGLDAKANITSGGDMDSQKSGEAVEAKIDFYLIGRPRKAYTNPTTIGNVVVTIAGAENEPDPNDDEYSNVYRQTGGDASSDMA